MKLTDGVYNVEIPQRNPGLALRNLFNLGLSAWDIMDGHTLGAKALAVPEPQRWAYGPEAPAPDDGDHCHLCGKTFGKAAARRRCFADGEYRWVDADCVSTLRALGWPLWSS